MLVPCSLAHVPTPPLPPEARLSVMVSDSSDSFLLHLYINKISIKALLDSGATHCFIDSSLVSDHWLPTHALPQPMHLQLFDGSFAPKPIQYEVTIPIYFAPGTAIPVSFLVTLLDPDISATLGISWLHHYNPLLDWVNNCIEFWTLEASVSHPPTTDSQSFVVCMPLLSF